jgi:adenylate cyclase
LRNDAWDLLHRFKELNFDKKLQTIQADLTKLFPNNAAIIEEEGAYLRTAAENLTSYLENFDSIQSVLQAALKDTFCIVGQTDAGTTDIGVNPFFNEYVNVGTQGVVLDTILRESFIIWLSRWWSALLCVITPLLIFCFAELEPGIRAALGVLSAILTMTASFFLFRLTGIFLNPLEAAFSLVLAALFREIAAYVVSDREKRFIRKAFSTYVSGDVVKELIADPSRLQLGGVKRHMSAIFTDIRGFSSIAEQLDPEDLVSLLNRYLTSMSDVILQESGTIDKYEGDAIIAFFGAPLDLPDHALRACLSAVHIKRTEKKLNALIMEQKLSPSPLLTRIGINTGSMVAGNMGTDNKMNYTIMGNTVNLAARLEGVNKQYGTWILASKAVLDETGGHFLSRRLDRIRVVGINEPVQIYEILETAEAAEGWQKAAVRDFEEALNYFENRDWRRAADGFSALINASSDGPSKFFLQRCNAFIKDPPPSGWDGVFNMDKK